VVGGVGRVVVGVSGSPASLEALRVGVAEARLRGCPVLAVLAWTPPGGELSGRAARIPAALLREWADAARRRLRTAFEEAMGGVPRDVDVSLCIWRGPAGRVLPVAADRPEDLLVVSAGTAGPVRRGYAGSVPRACLARARCRVLVVPPPSLVRATGGSIRAQLMIRRATALPTP
jgi:nucleotide-binding universal stress UspA family protein